MWWKSSHFFYLTHETHKKSLLLSSNLTASIPISFVHFVLFVVPKHTSHFFYLTTKYTKHTKKSLILSSDLIASIPILFRVFRAFRGSQYPSHKHSCQLVHIRVLENTTTKPIRVRHFVVPNTHHTFLFNHETHETHEKVNIYYCFFF